MNRTVNSSLQSTLVAVWRHSWAAGLGPVSAVASRLMPIRYATRSAMPQSRKETAYRKNRKFGDVYGGRTRARVPDGIFRRAHSLKRPGPHDQLPIVIEDNPSRKFFFPLTGDEVVQALEALPNNASAGLTHVWLRRASENQLVRGSLPLAEFVCGSGVRAVILYPWRRDLKICLGRKKPNGKFARGYVKFGAELIRERGWWYAAFSDRDLRRFYVENLLYHEVGHHVDWYERNWSGANQKQVEEAADQYAVQWSRTAKHVLNKIEKTRAA